MRILQTAGVEPSDAGGAGTTLRALARGYRAAGHSVVRVVPGDRDRRSSGADAEIVRVRAPRVPGSGRRVILNTSRMLALLDEFQPDRIEVSDRLTSQAVGRWAHSHGVPTVAISHERLDAVLETRVRSRRVARWLADFWNLRLVVSFDTIVCSTDWAGQEFERLGVENLLNVRPGVDLEIFHPDHRSALVRREFADDDEPLLVMADRLVPARQPGLAIETVRALHRRGLRARLIVAGAGPLLGACRRRASGLPIEFVGDLEDRHRRARLLASADVVLAPGAAETFGRVALEALGSGTAVVGNCGGALPELLDAAAGAVTYGHPTAFAEAVMSLLSMDEACRRAAARAHAERFGWPCTVEQMLAVHDAELRQAA